MSTRTTPDMIETTLKETAQLHAGFPEAQRALIAQASTLMTETLRAGRKIIWFGNGG